MIYDIEISHNLANCFVTKRYYKYYVFYSEYNEFLDELEEDPELRRNIDIFKDRKKQIPIDIDNIDSDIPQITLEEMLDDLTIIEDTTEMVDDDE